jgi:hypothetical protein
MPIPRPNWSTSSPALASAIGDHGHKPKTIEADYSLPSHGAGPIFAPAPRGRPAEMRVLPEEPARQPPLRGLVAEAVDLVVVIVGGSQPRRVREMVRVLGLDEAGRYEGSFTRSGSTSSSPTDAHALPAPASDLDTEARSIASAHQMNHPGRRLDRAPRAAHLAPILLAALLAAAGARLPDAVRSQQGDRGSGR